MAIQVADQTGYARGYQDPVRAVNPYTPTELVMAGNPQLPIVGVVALAGAVLLLEHLRRKRGR
ncbi:MAG: hypothetical protein AUG49_15970 [Catenulispora sp. 13_1_20CM_3_70_7]|nr:MAG: hypothetical protein AUG49_15970 [Catenulispora sp. 13_1_20CM_3_70_7]